MPSLPRSLRERSPGPAASDDGPSGKGVARGSPLQREDLRWLAGASLAGGVLLVPGLAPVLDPLPPAHVPPLPTSLYPEVPAAPRPMEPPSPFLVDAQWWVVRHGRYVTRGELMAELERGPIHMAWMGSQVGAPFYQTGPFVTPLEVRLRPPGELRAGSRECPEDRGLLEYDPGGDRWRCPTCGSEYSARDGRPLHPPSRRPLVTFRLEVSPQGARVALVPPLSRSPL